MNHHESTLMGQWVARCTLAMLLAVGVCSAQVEEPTRVGVFGLYRAQSLLIQPMTTSPTTVVMDGRTAPWRVSPQAKVRIERRGERLRMTLIKGRPGAGRFWIASKISLRSASSGELPTWRITIDDQRLMRVLQGELHLRHLDGTIQTILETDRQSLVMRVAASEMSGITEVEALKALAVVARTFIVANRSRHRSDGFDFCDTTHCQWYQGEDRLEHQDRFSQLVQRATRDTERMVLSHDGAIHPVYFTAVCGGTTATPGAVWNPGDSPDKPTYQSVSCHWCRGSKSYRWRRSISKEVFMAAISDLIGFTPSQWVEIVPEINNQRTVQAVWIKDRDRQTRLTGDAIRSRVGRRLGWDIIRSNIYTVEDRGDQLVFYGHGSGHNVGLCLSGAVAQGRAGRTFRDILEYYFPAAELKEVTR